MTIVGEPNRRLWSTAAWFVFLIVDVIVIFIWLTIIFEPLFSYFQFVVDGKVIRRNSLYILYFYELLLIYFNFIRNVALYHPLSCFYFQLLVKPRLLPLRINIFRLGRWGVLFSASDRAYTFLAAFAWWLKWTKCHLLVLRVTLMVIWDLRLLFFFFYFCASYFLNWIQLDLRVLTVLVFSFPRLCFLGTFLSLL